MNKKLKFKNKKL